MYVATIRTADGRLLPLTIFAHSLNEARGIAEQFVKGTTQTLVGVN